MDRVLMEEYYTIKYEEGEEPISFLDGTDYNKWERICSLLENELEELCGGADTELWQKYEAITAAYYDFADVIKKAIYLQGAYDRERMLR